MFFFPIFSFPGKLKFAIRKFVRPKYKSPKNEFIYVMTLSQTRFHLSKNSICTIFIFIQFQFLDIIWFFFCVAFCTKSNFNKSLHFYLVFGFPSILNAVKISSHNSRTFHFGFDKRIQWCRVDSLATSITLHTSYTHTFTMRRHSTFASTNRTSNNNFMWQRYAADSRIHTVFATINPSPTLATRTLH